MAFAPNPKRTPARDPTHLDLSRIEAVDGRLADLEIALGRCGMTAEIGKAKEAIRAQGRVVLAEMLRGG